MRRRAVAEADRVPAVRRKVARQRRRPAAASGLGTARDQTARDRIPTSSADLPLLRRNDLCAAPARRSSRAIRAAVGRLRWAVDGLLPPEQAAHGVVLGSPVESTLLREPDREAADAGHPGAAAGL